MNAYYLYYYIAISALVMSFMMMSMMDPVTRLGAVIRQVHPHR